MRSYYLQTSNPEQVVRIPANQADGAPEVIPAHDGPSDFNLVNTLRPFAINEARQAAKESGLRLKQVGVMGVMGTKVN